MGLTAFGALAEVAAIWFSLLGVWLVVSVGAGLRFLPLIWRDRRRGPVMYGGLPVTRAPPEPEQSTRAPLEEAGEGLSALDWDRILYTSQVLGPFVDRWERMTPEERASPEVQREKEEWGVVIEEGVDGGVRYSGRGDIEAIQAKLARGDDPAEGSLRRIGEYLDPN